MFTFLLISYLLIAVFVLFMYEMLNDYMVVEWSCHNVSGFDATQVRRPVRATPVVTIMPPAHDTDIKAPSFTVLEPTLQDLENIVLSRLEKEHTAVYTEDNLFYNYINGTVELPVVDTIDDSTTLVCVPRMVPAPVVYA